MKVPNSTKRLRDLRDAVRLATMHTSDCVTHSITLHFFEDCILGMHEKSADGRITRTHAVYSKDGGKTWHEYFDQFEPKEGEHRAIQYRPSDSSFPTSNW